MLVGFFARLEMSSLSLNVVRVVVTDVFRRVYVCVCRFPSFLFLFLSFTSLIVSARSVCKRRVASSDVKESNCLSSYAQSGRVENNFIDFDFSDCPLLSDFRLFVVHSFLYVCRRIVPRGQSQLWFHMYAIVTFKVEYAQ